MFVLMTKKDGETVMADIVRVETHGRGRTLHPGNTGVALVDVMGDRYWVPCGTKEKVDMIVDYYKKSLGVGIFSDID